jgi:hypothetical protein
MIEKPDLNEDELKQNYDEFIKFVGTAFTGDRRERLLKMYDEKGGYGITTLIAPASMAEHFHYAHPGGYLQHIMRVIKCARGMKKLYVVMGGTIDFTDEEMDFAAMHHDLGKLGDPELGEYYVPEDQDWKRRRGEIYKLNPKMQYMDAADRSVYVLQRFGVTYTWKEYLGIKLADGMYKDANQSYLKTYNKDFYLRSSLPKIIHAADYMSCAAEIDQWRKTND